MGGGDYNPHFMSLAVDRKFEHPVVIFEQDGKRYVLNEYPIDGEIVELIDHGRMYVLEGMISLRFLDMDVDFDSKAKVWIVLQVKYRVDGKDVNWVYLATVNNYLPSRVTGFAGYNLMMTSEDLFGPTQIFLRLNLEFRSQETHNRDRDKLFIIIRPTRPEDTIKYDSTDLYKSKYRKLKFESEPIIFRDDPLLRMYAYIA